MFPRWNRPLRAARHLALRGFLYALAALAPLTALYALFDAADHGFGTTLSTLSRLVSIAAQVAPVAACLGAVAAVAASASRGELRALAALGVRPTRPGLWVGLGALGVALAGGVARADVAPRIARAWADARPDPGALGWSSSTEPRWVLSAGDPVRCANATCNRVWSASATGIVLRDATTEEATALAARSPAPAMRLTPSELVSVARTRRDAGLSANALDVELWLRIALGVLGLLLPCAVGALVASRPAGARNMAFGAAASVAIVGLSIAALAQGATAGAWPAWLPVIPAAVAPCLGWLWARARSAYP